MLTAIPTLLMRGGTSKGLYFNANDLPTDIETRNAVLLSSMGSPDLRQIDGVGGAHPLTSKVAILSPSSRNDADIDYLFLQISVNDKIVSDSQPCGNILAGVGPWAIENNIVKPNPDVTPVRIHTINNGSMATAHIQTPNGKVEYEGDCKISGVPGTAAPIIIDFHNIAGSNCGRLFPTGNTIDTIDGVEITCIDNGMPLIILKASDFGLTGRESPQELDKNQDLKERLEKIRLAFGPKMNLGDVSLKTVPKMTLVSPPLEDGDINTRTFIPHRAHEAIGVLGAVSVATALLSPETVATQVSGKSANAQNAQSCHIEHPTGFFGVEIEADNVQADFQVKRASLLRTARKLFRGEVYVPSSICSGA